MTAWIIRFVIEWGIWVIFADKSRWKQILPVSFFAGYLSLVVDQLCELFDLWEYHSTDALADLINATGLYIVITYLFIQWLPTHNSRYALLRYFFIWTSVAIAIEITHTGSGIMRYKNWHLAYSYVADWVLFWIFYKFYKLFEFWKLKNKPGV